jgi:hypothetical protein
VENEPSNVMYFADVTMKSRDTFHMDFHRLSEILARSQYYKIYSRSRIFTDSGTSTSTSQWLSE